MTRMSTKRMLIAFAATAGMAVPAISQAGVAKYRTNLTPLNASLQDGQGAHGTATVTVNDNDPSNATIHVNVHATGLPDLSNLTDTDGNAINAAHAAHIHGQFAANNGVPATQQGANSRPFFSGEGGTAVDSKDPSLAQDDGNNNGYLNFFEGLPKYGPVLLNLSSSQVPPAPDGTAPLNNALNFLGDNNLNPTDVFPTGTEFNRDTTYSFNLNQQDDRRAFNNLGDLGLREIVLHGLLVPTDISNALNKVQQSIGQPAALQGTPVGNGDLSFRPTGPVAAGELVRVVPTPAAALMGLGLLGGLITKRRGHTA